jgi:mono/diheme cytochrome c family protein
MKIRSVHILIAAAALMGINGMALAAGNEKVDPGKQEYVGKCAVCHGQSGKGDGGMIDVLNRTPTDLTTLAKKNGGVFPVDRVYSVIDGREVVKGHGTRDMPVWGTSYSMEGARAGEMYFDVPYTMDMYVRARILSLIDYLNRIQVK